MVDIFRDAPVGYFFHFLTGGKLFAYSDDKALAVSGSSTPPDNINSDAEKQDVGPRTAESIVDWYHDNDQDNPKNWSLQKRVFVLEQIMYLNFSVYIGSSIVVPIEPKLTELFGASAQSAALSLSLFVLGYGIGPMFFSPISEIPRTGRNIPYLSSLLLFVLFTVGAATVNSFAGFVVFRFLQGFFGGPVLATGGASATDLFSMLKGPYAVAS
ncbi:MFS general substrate transporter [Xylariaceae sp. AK1471]|nr:MFS general substrate transporter [Xylariaceae sp. AK1471]